MASLRALPITRNGTLISELRSLEERLLDPEIRRDRSAVASLLAPDFVEYGASGSIFTRETILDLLESEEPVCIRMADFAARLLAPHLALTTWRSIRSDGKQCLRTSLWILREGRWQNLFHQGTPVLAEHASHFPACAGGPNRKIPALPEPR